MSLAGWWLLGLALAGASCDRAGFHRTPLAAAAPTAARASTTATQTAAPVAVGQLAVVPGLTATIPTSATVGVPRLEADVAAVITESYYGGAVQWDPHEWFDLDPARWQRLLRRVEFMHLGYIRCMLQTYWYCTGFKDGQPVYVWEGTGENGGPQRDATGQPLDRNGIAIAENLRRMRKLYDILDFCQEHQIDVLCGEWGAPAMVGWIYGPAEHLKPLDIHADDPRYAEIVGALLQHLVVDRGYTCIKEFNLGNEVNLASAYDATWTQARWQTSIRNLHRELARLGLADRVRIVGPDAGYWSDLWYHETLTELADEIGTYDLHWYVHSNQVRRHVVEDESRLLRNFASLHHPERALIYGEIGLCDDLQGDQQWHVREVGYGVSMAAALIQAMRAGFSAGVAWSLDDAIHLNGPLPADYQYRLTPATVTKVWGFWNSLGVDAGRPEDEALRPWYTPWALLSRCFPKGAKILRVSDGRAAGLSVVAAKIPATAGRWHVSFALTNDTETPASCVFAIPGVPPLPVLTRYVYNADERPADTEGFPVPAAHLADVDLTHGLPVTVPARAVLVYSSLEDGSPVALPEAPGADLIDTMGGLQQVCAHSGNLGFNGFAEHPNRRVQQDLDLHSELFLGNRQRLHRSTSDQSAFLTWKLHGVSSFRVGIFHRDQAAGRVRVSVSSDQAAWQETGALPAYTEPMTAGWSFTLLVPSQDVPVGNHYVRLEFLPVGAFNETQLAYVELAAGILPDLRVTDVEPLLLRQTVGFAPDLPATLILHLNHAIPRRLPVRWSSAGADWNTAGISTITGRIAETEIAATATIEMVSRLTDPMDSLDLAHATSANLGIDVANAEAVGDQARFMRTSADEANVVYRFAGLREFELDAFLYGTDDIQEFVAVEVSPDGATWQAVPIAATPLSASPSAWRRYRLTNASRLPEGSGYLRVELAAHACTWIQQLGQITLQTR